MAIHTAMSFAMAAVCFVAIATVSASYAAAQGQTVTVKHAPITNPGDVSGSWSAQRNVIESTNTSSCCGQILLFGRRGCRRSADQLTIRNCIKAV